jgi:hypothetical protein
MRWAVKIEYMEDMRDSYGILGGKPEEKRQSGRPRCR